MKVFVCEFVTGGGLYRDSLPPSLAREGGMMLETLLSDLLMMPELDILTTRDSRLSALELPVSVIPVTMQDADIWQRWEACITSADMVWPIAPESGGVLERLSQLVLQHEKVLLNSLPKAVAVAASKMQTSRILSASGLVTIPTTAAGDWEEKGNGPWIAKLDDGAGCEDTRVFDNAEGLRHWLQQGHRKRTHIVQPYLAGEAASLSLLCRDGNACLLSCNRQKIAVRDGALHYTGSVLNGMAQHWDRCEAVAQAIVRAIPDLAGYIGVDVLIQESDIVVVEINPRLTTSYAGLQRASNCNPARLVVDMFYNEQFSWPRAISRNTVEISVDE